jgi:hypothetical protein
LLFGGFPEMATQIPYALLEPNLKNLLGLSRIDHKMMKAIDWLFLELLPLGIERPQCEETYVKYKLLKDSNYQH